MVYLIGFIGFISGFALGQGLLALLLRDRTNEDLKTDPALRIYGVLNWLIAILCTVATVSVYKAWFE